MQQLDLVTLSRRGFPNFFLDSRWKFAWFFCALAILFSDEVALVAVPFGNQSSNCFSCGDFKSTIFQALRTFCSNCTRSRNFQLLFSVLNEHRCKLILGKPSHASLCFLQNWKKTAKIENTIQSKSEKVEVFKLFFWGKAFLSVSPKVKTRGLEQKGTKNLAWVEGFTTKRHF